METAVALSPVFHMPWGGQKKKKVALIEAESKIVVVRERDKWGVAIQPV